MPAPYLVKPDREFLHRILDEGGDDLKKCFQCATCSVVCELSNGGKPFPRKEMVWAQWGLKDRLVADPDVWLCHQCNDCSTRCPRGARPGDVLTAVRQQSIRHYAVPGVFAAWANQVKFLPVMLLIPLVLLLGALLLRPLGESGPLAPLLQFADHPGFYAKLFPHWLLIGFYSFFWGLAMLGAAVGVVRFWRAMKAADEAAGSYSPVLGIVSSIKRTLMPIFKHDKFSQCGGQAARRLAHLCAFYGFVALFLVSVWAVIALYGINPFIEDHHDHLVYPFKQLNPWKILANLGAVALIAGCVIAIRERLANKDESGTSTSFDWLFVGLLLGVGISGVMTEVMRLIGEAGTGKLAENAAYKGTAYTVYLVHLVLVVDLLVYLPYSKFAHVVYRTVALVYSEHSGRKGDVQKT